MTEKSLCPLKFLAKTFGGKWKLSILCILADGRAWRYSEIKRRLGDNITNTITNTMLAKSLRELEADGMIHRKEYDEKILHVEYSLTERGKRALPMLTAAAEWAVNEMNFEKLNPRCEKCYSK